jgi:hypothetical protein
MAQSGNVSPAAAKQVEILANLQRHLTDMNSPGVQLSLKEIERKKTSDRTIVEYDLYATGLPGNLTYNLFTVEPDGSVAEGVTLNGSGQAICAGKAGTCHGDKPDDPIHLAVFAGKGEPKRFALASTDKKQKQKGFVQVIPFPNISTDQQCRLEVVLGTPLSEVVFIQGSGFEPNSLLTTVSQSEDERLINQQNADAKGDYFSALLPYVEGKDAGKSSFEVKAKGCSPKVSYEWGKGSYHLE